MLLPLAIAATHPAALLVGSNGEWNEACLQRSTATWDRRCFEETLSWVHTDVWKAATVLSVGVDPGATLIFLAGTDREEVGERIAGLPRPGGGGSFGQAVQPVEPTLPALAQAVGELRNKLPPGDELALTVYVAAHGTPAGEVQLPDGRYPVEALIEALSPEGVTLTLAILDVCYSGNSRSGPVREAQYRALGRSSGAHVLAAVEDQAYEIDRLQGGSFTLLVLSAMAGAADGDGDEKVDASELSVHVQRYIPSLNRSFVPDFRSPGGSPGALVASLDSKPVLLLQHAEPSRWLIQVEGTEPVLIEAHTDGGSDRLALRLPTQLDYQVWRLPDGALFAETCLVQALPGAFDCEPELRLIWYDRSSSDEAPPVPPSVQDHLAVVRLPPAPPPAQPWTAHGQAWIWLGPMTSSRVLEQGPELGLALSAELPWHTRASFLPRLVLHQRVPREEAVASLQALTLGAELDLGLACQERWRLGLTLGGDALALRNDSRVVEAVQWSLVGGPRVGLSSRHRLGSAGLRVELAWVPLVLSPSESRMGRAELSLQVGRWF